MGARHTAPWAHQPQLERVVSRGQLTSQKACRKTSHHYGKHCGAALQAQEDLSRLHPLLLFSLAISLSPCHSCCEHHTGLGSFFVQPQLIQCPLTLSALSHATTLFSLSSGSCTHEAHTLAVSSTSSPQGSLVQGMPPPSQLCTSSANSLPQESLLRLGQTLPYKLAFLSHIPFITVADLHLFVPFFFHASQPLQIH